MASDSKKKVLFSLFQKLNSLQKKMTESSTRERKKSGTSNTSSSKHEEKYGEQPLKKKLTMTDYAERIKKFTEASNIELPVKDNDIRNFSDERKKEVLEHMTTASPLIHGSLLIVFYRFLQIKKTKFKKKIRVAHQKKNNNKKKKHGSKVEKALYSNMKLDAFVDRFFSKRPLVFFNSYDHDMLRNGASGAKLWDKIGTDEEGRDNERVLQDYMSYDEVMLSALCGASSHVHFINKGDRNNFGIKAKDGKWPMEGVYVGLVGARFERECKMEHVHMCVSRGQTEEEGFGDYIKSPDIRKARNASWKCLEEFYAMKHVPSYFEIDSLFQSDPKKNSSPKKDKTKTENSHNKNTVSQTKDDPTTSKNSNSKSNHDESTETGPSHSRHVANEEWKRMEFHKCPRSRGGSVYLNMQAYRMRMRISIELFLFDANQRAKDLVFHFLILVFFVHSYLTQLCTYSKDKHKQAYCHVVGLGTGVWAIDQKVQNRTIIEVFYDIVKTYELPFVKAIDFSWFEEACNYRTNKTPIFETQDNKWKTTDASGKHTIDVFFSKRDPAAPLEGDYSHCLNVAMYAWDGNSFPGNEYWLKMLSASGDPAAACCSTITFIHNPYVNEEYMNGSNSRVYFGDAAKKTYSCWRLGDLLNNCSESKIIEMSLLNETDNPWLKRLFFLLFVTLYLCVKNKEKKKLLILFCFMFCLQRIFFSQQSTEVLLFSRFRFFFI
ncbi:hypothetical protein RFI_25212 [Reticulomyxa filosa]|uniref:Uncharacterized protein n=1 Tax=Reticulomyxa filosa TaxID=46433 RepID=X6MGI8_RETFI|nr:hypothetical protein RFI_25212 [Reticulomyxa filosa]|eukprot:ETO12165.1 hypothetical protein RFI_25212 [Reticulomyxa filosa]